MKRLAAAFLATVICLGAVAQQKVVSPKSRGMDQDHLALVDGVIGEAIAAGTIPGAVLAVVRGDDIVWLKAYGNKSIVPETVPMTTGTMFDLASCSKAMGTTLAIMQLIENGKLLLEDKVRDFIPDFAPWSDPGTGEEVQIRVRDLLTHSSGLAPYIDVNSFVKEYGENCPELLERFIATKVKRNFRPGTDVMYSCLNFITLQRILERITGQKLYEYVQQNVFAPLSLKHTCYFPLDPSLPKLPGIDYEALAALCAPTTVQEDGLPLVAKVHDPIARKIMGGNSGNAGMFSDARDLSAICSAIMKRGGDILKPMTTRLMATVPEWNDPKVGRTLGWDTKSGREDTIMHTGYTGTSVEIDLKTHTAVILLTNRVHPEDKGSVSRLRSQISNIVASSIKYGY